MAQPVVPTPALKQLRVPKKDAPAITKEGTGPSTAPLTPSGVTSNAGGTLSAESSTTDLLACGLFEDELEDLQELLVAHSPKNLTSLPAQQ